MIFWALEERRRRKQRYEQEIRDRVATELRAELREELREEAESNDSIRKYLERNNANGRNGNTSS